MDTRYLEVLMWLPCLGLVACLLKVAIKTRSKAFAVLAVITLGAFLVGITCDIAKEFYGVSLLPGWGQ